MNKRLLIIGVDAGSPALLQQWAAAGDLPNLRRLMKRGESRRVENPYALEAGAVWPVFHTGQMPGNQPQYDGRRRFDPRDYSVSWFDAAETAPSVWRRLSEEGVECLLLDPPYLTVDEPIRGTTVVDWGTHVPANGHSFELRSNPPEVAQEVLDVVGPDPAGGVMCDRRAPETIDDHRRFRDIYLERIALKGKLAAHLLRTRSWDVALIASTDLHCTGHHLWHVNHREHPAYSERLEAALGEPLRDCYRAFDASLEQILEAAGPDTTVMVFGSHGMGPAYSGTGLLDRMLWQLDMDQEATAPPRPSTAQRLRAPLRRLWRALPAEARGRLRPLRRPFRGRLRPSRFIGDREQRRFFEVYANDATGGVRFNLEGREGNGKVTRAQADQLVHYLATELRRIENVDTGEPVVDEVVDTRERYLGPHIDQLPDLLIRWNRRAPIRAVRSPAIGELVHEYANNRTGDHTPSGLCIVAGPAVAGDSIGEDIRTADIAPTIAAWFGVELEPRDGEPFTIAAPTERRGEPASATAADNRRH